jgi:transcriptional regulator with XRE-family HTH domain
MKDITSYLLSLTDDDKTDRSFDANFASNFKKARKSHKLKQEDLSREIKHHVVSISRWEHQRHLEKFRIVGIIEERLGKSICELIPNEETQQNNNDNGFGFRLEKAMKDAGISRIYLESEIDYRNISIHRWIHGENIGIFKQTALLEKVLDKSIYELFTDREIPRINEDK